MIATAVVVAVFIFLGEILGPYYATLTGRDQIDFWVSVGTIAMAILTAVLALATTFTVYESRAFLHAEDIRHQEQYAPYVTLEIVSDYEKGQQFTLVRGFQLVSRGIGPAIITAYKVAGIYYRPQFVQQKDVFALERGESLTLDLDVSGIFWYLPVAHSTVVKVKEFEYEAGRAPGGVPDTYIEFGMVVVEYEDVFQNAYRTVYEDFGAGSHRWVKPRIHARTLSG